MEEHCQKELQAAYLSLKSVVADDLSSPAELRLALQYAGHNPTQSEVEGLWNARGISFENYLNICDGFKEPTDSVYRTFDALSRQYGKIPVSEFKKMILAESCGEVQFSEEDLDAILRESDCIKDDSLDCNVLSRSICATADELKKLSVRRLDDNLIKQRKNSTTFTKHHRKPQIKANSRESWFSTKINGNFFHEDSAIVSHQFGLDITSDGEAIIKIQLNEDVNSSKELDIMGYIFHENAEGNRFFVGVTENKDNESANFWQGHLNAGKYHVIPFTTGLNILNPAFSIQNRLKLIDKDNSGKIFMTQQFEGLLMKIFGQLDLDKSGGLNQQEFNLYNLRTSGEEVQHSEWEVVLTNFSCLNEELTPEGFLELHRLEAEDSGGIEEDLWLTIKAMGYNGAGDLTTCAGYNLTALSQNSPPVFIVTGLRPGGLTLDKAIVRHVMQSSQPVRLEGDVIKYEYVNPYKATLVFQNKSQRAVSLRVDLSRSSNVRSHRGSLDTLLQLPAKSALVAHHVLPAQPNMPWNLVSVQTLQ